MIILASQIKGLSDPTRLRILNLLKDGELCVCDLMAVLDIPQSTISRHLSYLRKTDWVEARRMGKWMHYQRSTRSSSFQAHAFAMLDEALTDNHQAKADSKALVRRLADKTEDACATACAGS